MGYRPYESVWLIYVHVLGLVGLIWFAFMDIKIRILIAFVILHTLTGLGVTAGAHRLWAHKCYTASYPLRVFLMLMNSNCFEGNIFHWSRDHRLHHKFSDTELDPHTILNGFFFSHVGWLLKKKTAPMVEEGRKCDL
jgi:stearoyl-CoA desaturase (delta-9 desaturase)